MQPVAPFSTHRQLRSLPSSLAHLLDAAAVITVAAGFLLGLLSGNQPTLSSLLVFTAVNVLWMATYARISRSDPVRPRLVALAILAVLLSGLAGAMARFGLGYDWLLPVVTIGVVAGLFSLRPALLLSALTWFLSAIVVFWLSMPLTPASLQNAILASFIELPPAFIFTFVFMYIARRQQEERQRAEALVIQLEAAQEQLRAYANEVEELAVTRERNRMAREIHDTLGHYLTLLAVQLETALKMEERDDERLREELTEARRVATECLAEVRTSVAALRPADPTAQSFSSALEHLAGEFEATQPEIEIVLDVEGPVQELSPELRIALYRCAQESFTNIRKHAHATKVLLRLRVEDGMADLTIVDNGTGRAPGDQASESGFGLLGIRERIALLGGSFVAQPGQDHGWRVHVRIPAQFAQPLASEASVAAKG